MRRLGDSWVARFLVELLPQSGELEPPEEELLVSRFPVAAERLFRSELLRPRSWGSEYPHDPWPETLPESLPEAVESDLRARFTAQRPGRMRRLTWRLRAFAAEVSLEDHEDSLALAVRGSGAERQPHVLELVHRLAAAAGIGLRSEEQLQADVLRLQSLGRELDGAAVALLRQALVGLGALWHSDLRLLDLLRGLLPGLQGHPLAGGPSGIKAALIAAASRAGYRLFLYELLAAESDPLLRRILLSLTAFQVGSAAEG